MDHLRYYHGFANPCASKESSFSSPLKGGENVNGFDAGFEDFRCRCPLVDRHWFAVDGSPELLRYVSFSVNGLSEHVKHPAKQVPADGHGHGLARVDNHRAASQALGRGECNAPNDFRIEVDLHFNGYLAIITGFQQGVYEREFFRKMGVHDTSAH